MYRHNRDALNHIKVGEVLTDKHTELSVIEQVQRLAKTPII